MSDVHSFSVRFYPHKNSSHNFSMNFITYYSELGLFLLRIMWTYTEKKEQAILLGELISCLKINFNHLLCEAETKILFTRR